MKKFLKPIAAAAIAVCVCLSLSACGNSEEQDLEKRLNALDGMSEEAERELEKGLNALDDENSAASENPQAAAAARYLAEKLYTFAKGGLARLAVSNEEVPDFNVYKYELMSEKSGKFETEINGKTKKVKYDLDKSDVYGEVKNYDIKYVTVTVDGVSCTYPEGADKVELVDAFANLAVTFSGIAPNSKVTVLGAILYANILPMSQAVCSTAIL